MLRRLVELLILSALVACGSGSSEPETEPAGKPMDICEKTDPKNVIITCTTVDGLRSCRAENRCR